MASSHSAALAAYSDFQIRVDYFLKKAAIAVMAEDSGTANHDQRVVFAREIFDGRQRIYDFALGVTTNSTLTATIGTSDESTANAAISDNDLEFTVNSMYTAYSL
jgi:hypothetical protein